MREPLTTDFSAILDLVVQLPERAAPRRTFMEIAGYPHLENVCSNIMAYYFDPRSDHGLGDTVLSSFLSAAAAPTPLTNIIVEREAVTDTGKRIDLLVLADELVIGIENKIYAGLYNDLADYQQHLKKVADGRPTIGVVIGLTAVDAKFAEFVSVTYEKWFEVLLPELGRAALGADLQRVASLLDFITSIRNLTKRNPMDGEIVKLFRDRGEDVKGLLAKVDEFQRELRRKVEGVGDLLILPDGVIRGFYRERFGLYDMLVHDVLWLGDQRVAVDAVLSASGWEFVVLNRRGAAVDIPAVLAAAELQSRPWLHNSNRFVIPDLTCDFEDDNSAVTSLQRVLNGLADVRDSSVQ